MMRRRVLYFLSLVAFGLAIVFLFQETQPSCCTNSHHVVSMEEASTQRAGRSSRDEHSRTLGDLSVSESEAGSQTTVDLNMPAGRNINENASLVAARLRHLGLFIESDDLVPLFDSGAVGELHIERMQQLHSGVPVYASSLLVLRRGEELIEIEGPIATVTNLSVDPEVTSAFALNRVTEAGFTEVTTCTDALYIYLSNNVPVLVWCFTEFTTTHSRDILVNAHTGDLVRIVSRGL